MRKINPLLVAGLNLISAIFFVNTKIKEAVKTISEEL